MTDPAETIQALANVRTHQDDDSYCLLGQRCAGKVYEAIGAGKVPGLMVSRQTAETIQRYKAAAPGTWDAESSEGMTERLHGDFVRYDDHARILAAALAEVDSLRRDESRISHSLIGQLESALSQRDDALAKLAQVTGERNEARVESTTNRLALALWMNGDTPNQPLIDDIERWRQELTDGTWAKEMAAQLTVVDEGEKLRALLSKARDSVEFEVQENKANWGERLMHKQEPAIELLKRIDEALMAGRQG